MPTEWWTNCGHEAGKHTKIKMRKYNAAHELRFVGRGIAELMYQLTFVNIGFITSDDGHKAFVEAFIQSFNTTGE